MSQHDSPRRLALKDAAHLLRLTADDYASMAERERTAALKETLLGRKQQRNMTAQCLAEKAQLLRGQAERIEHL